MKINFFFFVVIVAMIGLVFYNRTHGIHAEPPPPGVIPHNSTFHKPLHADCPQGTKLMADYFDEKDGSKLDACFNPNGDGSTDYLSPGEGCTIRIPIVIEESDDKRPRT